MLKELIFYCRNPSRDGANCFRRSSFCSQCGSERTQPPVRETAKHRRPNPRVWFKRPVCWIARRHVHDFRIRDRKTVFSRKEKHRSQAPLTWPESDKSRKRRVLAADAITLRRWHPFPSGSQLPSMWPTHAREKEIGFAISKTCYVLHRCQKLIGLNSALLGDLACIKVSLFSGTVCMYIG